MINQLQSGVKLDTVKFKKNPPQKLKISIDSAETILAKNCLELGNLFLTEFEVPDSAYNLYIKILDRYPSPVYYPNTLYALGSYYLTIDNKPKADSLFNIIYVDYKDRTIVNAAANKLNKPLIDLKFDPAKDMYASAEDVMLQGNFNKSIADFYKIYNEYPKSPIAPQALYSAGWILENEVFFLDSAASVYDTLMAKYPASVYAKKIIKKVSAYKQEKVRIQKAIQDSINALSNLMKDSLLAANSVITSDSSDNVENVSVLEDEDEVNMNELVNAENDVLNNDKQTVVMSKKKLEPLWDPRKHFN